MARFRPLQLFRRLSSRESHPQTANDKLESSPTSSPGTTPPPPKARTPAYSTPSPQAVRKSRSLPKLRKKLVSAGSEGGRDVEVPEAVAEQRESVLFISGEEDVSLGTTTAATTPADGQTPEEEAKLLGGETLLSRRLRDSNLVDEKQASVQTAELRLDEVECLRKSPPIVTVEKPTPDAEEVLTREIRRESEGGSPKSPPHSRLSGEVVIPTLESPELVQTPEKEQILPSTIEITPTVATASVPTASIPPHLVTAHARQASIVDSANVEAVATLLHSPTTIQRIARPTAIALPSSAPSEFFTPAQAITAMLTRKIWVKRPGASATLVQIKEDDLVDDVRDMILKKYANSLGKTFDSPDVTLSLVSRAEGRSPGVNQQRLERLLGPEEEMCRTLDTLYPGGQKVDEALLINLPPRRTPKHSPRLFQQQQQQMAGYQAMEEYRPLEDGTDYFPPMQAVVPQTIAQSTASHDSRASLSHHHHPSVAHQGHLIGAAEGQHPPRSISVINTGQVPPLPSPGAASRRLHQHRPKFQRQATSSPTIAQHPGAGALAVNTSQLTQQGVPVGNPAALPGQPHMVHRGSMRPRLDSSASEHPVMNGMLGNAPVPPPLPTPPAPEAGPTNKNNSQPPTPSGGAPFRPSRPRKPRRPGEADHKASRSRPRKQGVNGDASNVPSTSPLAGMLDNTVPPINVLIVEDNIINLRILEGLMKRLKVRWQTAMNGQIAVDKWKAGGFHLVLMDIQMPIMNGLQATKEIRRLERVNNIGVFGSPTETETGATGVNGDVKDAKEKKASNPEDDKLATSDSALFKSPIIIVALTASSLQSDRHEALAAGCNDFLTKPVNFVWLERKVKEWGCMQALIDFDGWRKWKDYAAQQEAGKSEEEKKKEREKEEKDRIKADKMAKLQEKQAKRKEEEAMKKKRQSFGAASSESAAAIPGSSGSNEANGGLTASPSSSTTLRPGTEVIGEAGMNE